MIEIGYALLAASLAVFLEWQYRSEGSYQLWWVPIYIALSLVLYHLIQTGSTLISSIALFSLGTLVGRLMISQFLLDESLRGGNLVAAALLAAAWIAPKIWPS